MKEGIILRCALEISSSVSGRRPTALIIISNKLGTRPFEHKASVLMQLDRAADTGDTETTSSTGITQRSPL